MKKPTVKQDDDLMKEAERVGKLPFDAADMEKRWKRLKAEGKVPPLSYLLDVVARVKRESETATAKNAKPSRTKRIKP